MSRLLDGPLDLPPSRRYLEHEVRNLLDAFEIIQRGITAGEDLALTPAQIRAYNELVLRNVEGETRTRPGDVRDHEIWVGRYRGPPAEECAHLLDRLCEWLACADFEVRSDDPLAFVRVLTRALLAHLYLAWIHPFSDGNGRTARLVEYHLLVASDMVPTPAAHLLSNHYNRTRSRYYEVLDQSSRIRPWSPVGFIDYALAGFVDGLQEQSAWVRTQHMFLAWQSYVDEVMRPYDTSAGRRQRVLALSLSPSRATPRREITMLTPKLAAAYAGKTSKTVTRDINRLISLGLVERTREGIRPRITRMEAFLTNPTSRRSTRLR